MATMNPSVKDRAYAAAHFALELDGKKDDVGLFRSVEGGSIKADVMTYQNGANYDRWRQLGKPKFEDIKASVGMSMSRPFYAWISEFFNGQGTRKTGAILAADYNYETRARREFSQALIKEITFPKLDGTDKSPAYLGVAIAVENLEFKPGDGAKLAVLTNFDSQKMWTACNFRFKLDGIPDNALLRVSKIDSFTIKQNILEYHTGTQRAPVKVPSQVDFPQITFYVPEADAGPFIDRFKEQGIKGTVRNPTDKTGELVVFDTDEAQNELFQLEFFGSDIANVQFDKADASSEEIKQVKIELYTERMKFTYKG
jgi:phage tail-like protein